MSMEQIRQHRGVPAKRGMRVYDRHHKKHGTIVGAKGGYVRIRLDGQRYAHSFHPTWHLDYLDKNGDVLFSSPRSEA